MKLFVISDTHGKINKVLEVYRRLTDIDMIIHLGDVEQDVRRISEAIGREVVSVKGNNDGSYTHDDYKILETEFGNIYLTHGHIQQVKFDLQKLYYRTQELSCKAVLFGHTHIPVFTESEGVYFVNPGSLTLPSDGTAGSYAIVHTSKEEFTASIIYYNQSFQKPSSNKRTGGFLRNLLNKSDRL